MKKLILCLLSLVILTACSSSDKKLIRGKENRIVEDSMEIQSQLMKDIINKEGMSIEERISTPIGYSRVEVNKDSFAYYLRKLELKPHDSKVLYYNGEIKENYGTYVAVVNQDIGTKNLQQCADAIMRLRGEYLFQRGNYEGIHFNLTNGFRVDYSKWIEGYRVDVNGNETYWVKKKQPSNLYEDFRNYMEFIFTYAGTLSLSKELDSVNLREMQIGDVLIQGGSPGHAVIIVDMAVNEETGDKIYMLAQSYMPAQDIHILSNPNNKNLSPWYVLNEMDGIITPEWSFTENDLKRFPALQ